jgi:hypothetical protein
LVPQPADGQGGKAITEWKRVGAGVEHDTCLEACAQLVAQVAQPGEVPS